MPCDQIITSTVKFSMKDTDFSLLRMGMLNLGYSTPESDSQGNLTFYRGYDKVRFKGDEVSMTLDARKNQADEMNAIKRAYSTQVVMSQAKKFGWKLKEKSPGKFVVQKAGK